MRAMRHVRDTRWTSSVGELTDSARDTIPSQQDKREQRQQQQQISFYFGGVPKIRGCLLLVPWPWLKQYS